MYMHLYKNSYCIGQKEESCIIHTGECKQLSGSTPTCCLGVALTFYTAEFTGILEYSLKIDTMIATTNCAIKQIYIPMFL